MSSALQSSSAKRAGSRRAQPSPQAPSSPAPRRTRLTRWRDARLLSGVLLILASVVLGGRLLASAGHTQSWLSVTRTLPAGHVLEAADVAPVKAHLPAPTSRGYFTAPPSRLVGRVLSRPLAAGELLPANAISSDAATPATRVLPVIVKAGRLPALSPGDHVDLYVFARPSGSGAGRELRVLTDVEFVGADQLSSGDASVQLRVSPAEAPAAIAASQSERIDLVRVDRDAANRPGEAGPSDVPGFGAG